MKIGIAFSGCDMGGLSAGSVLRELQSQGLDIGMISVCCIPAAPALLYSHGCERDAAEKLMKSFLDNTRESDIDFAVANLSASVRQWQKEKIPLSIASVNVADGKIIAFTDALAFDSENLRTFPLDDPYDALSATISLMDGLGSYHYEDARLCDFCCWYGTPVHLLHLAGMRKVLSVSFVPQFPKSPYEVLVKQTIGRSAHAADLHIDIEFADRNASFEEYAKIAVEKIKNYKNKIFFKMMF